MSPVQRVVRRSVLLSRLLTVAVALAALSLGYAVFWSNLSPAGQADWISLLDVQSATAALLASGGAALARAQYARAVRPALGQYARVVADLAPDGRLVWAVQLINGAQDVAVVVEAAYTVQLLPAAPGDPVPPTGPETDVDGAARTLEGRGLVPGADFVLISFGPGSPLIPQRAVYVAWFTAEAMREVREVCARVRVIDRVGDVHERRLLLIEGVGAHRNPVHPHLDPI